MHKTPTIHVPVSVSRPPFSTNDGQLRSVYRLGKTCVLIPIARRRRYQTQISCFSLFTMSKTIKVQTNIKPPEPGSGGPGSGGSMPARQRRAKPKPLSGGSMPVAERRQSKNSDEIHQKPEGRMVGRGGLEPPTSRLSGVRSNQLSYRPQKSGNPDRRSRGWWSLPGSNRRPSACKADALPTELRPQALSKPEATPARASRSKGYVDGPVSGCGSRPLPRSAARGREMQTPWLPSLERR